MSTVPAALVAMLVLSVAGLMPAIAAAGLRTVTVVLAPLAGSVLAALAATCFVEWGWTLVSWFALLAFVAGAAVCALWFLRPARRPRLPGAAGGAVRWMSGARLLWLIGAVGAVCACAWSLRGLATPTVGFDARALWLLRGGWLLEPHRQVLIDFTSPDLPLVQSPSPPLVSSVTAVARDMTGNASMRLGVVVVALLNVCALLAATLALLEAGRAVVQGLRDPGAPRSTPMARRESGGWLRVETLVPPGVAAIAAVALVFVAFGITEPFMTNGYADPIWSLAAVGAIAWGLQLPLTSTNQAVAAVLVLVGGSSKNEGAATACALILLMAARALGSMVRTGHRPDWWKPAVVAVGELAVVGSWPLLMQHIHARAEVSSYSPAHYWPHRARVTYDTMAPYLHVLAVAVPVALIGWLVLGRVRRAGGLANDGWAWAGLACGLVIVGATFVTAKTGILELLMGAPHRVTQFGALAGWWIVATWAVAASAAPLTAGRSPPSTVTESRKERGSGPTAEGTGLRLDVPVP